jgi:CRP-like cAMP-binding protein
LDHSSGVLTSDPEREIIYFVGWIAVLLANSMLFSPSSAFSSFVIGNCLLRNRTLKRGPIMTLLAASKKVREFDPKTFLSTINGGRTIEAVPKKQTIFAQGDSGDAVFYIKDGKVKLTVVSKIGKEATIGILNKGDFFGEGCLTGQPLRLCSATAMTDCSVMKIDKKSMIEVLHREHTFSDMFVAYLLTRNIRYERIWLTSFSIPVKKDWPEYCYCWLISARTEGPRL